MPRGAFLSPLPNFTANSMRVGTSSGGWIHSGKETSAQQYVALQRNHRRSPRGIWKTLGGNFATMLAFIHPSVYLPIHLFTHPSIHLPKCRLYSTVAVMVLLAVFGGLKDRWVPLFKVTQMLWRQNQTITQTASHKSSGGVSRIIEELPTCKWVRAQRTN